MEVQGGTATLPHSSTANFAFVMMKIAICDTFVELFFPLGSAARFCGKSIVFFDGGTGLERFILRAYLRTPVIKNGYMTLDAVLMAELGREVTDILMCEDGLYYASAAFLVDDAGSQKAAFVASMRADRTPEWLGVIRGNTKNDDVAIGEARAREAGNVINSYDAKIACAVEWYATGQMATAKAALEGVRFIGKRRNAGFGEVIRWEAEQGNLDGLVGYFGEPLRPIPASRWTEGGDQIAIDTAWKPPYWEIGNRARCFAPMEMP